MCFGLEEFLSLRTACWDGRKGFVLVDFFVESLSHRLGHAERELVE